MPPEISPLDRNDVFRDRKNERVWNGNVGARWRDRDRERDVRLFQDRHWGSNEFRRPNGYGKQGWQTYTEDFARGPGPSRPNRRFFYDGSCLPIEKYGRESSRDIRGGSFGQRDWRGHCWDAVPGPRSNGCANMPVHESMKRSADDMLAYNSYPHPNIGNSWGQFHLKDHHYNNSVASGQHTRRRFGRKNSDGLNARKPLKWTRSGSLYSRGCGIGHSSSPRSLGLDYSEVKVPSHLQNPSPVHSPSGNSATCATIAPSEETNSRGCGISHSSSPKSLRLDSGEIKVPVHPQNPSLVHSLTGNAVACATSTPAEETNSSGCGFSHSSSPKSLGLNSAYAPAEEANSRKKPRLGWGEGLAQFEKIINGSTDTENDGMIESPQSHSKNYAEPVHSHNSVVALRSSRVQCITEFPSPVTPSAAFCSSPGEDRLSVKAVDVDTSNLCSSPCPESQNQRDGLAFNLENLEVTGLVNFSSSLSELLPLNNLHSVESDVMRSGERSKLLVVKAEIAKKVEIIESEIDLLENELKTVISDTGNVSTCSTASSALQVKCKLKPLEELCATSNLTARPAPLVPNCFGDMMKMSPGGLEGELEESRNVDIDSIGTAASKVAEPLLAGMLFSEKTHKYGESTLNAERDVRKGKYTEENSGAIFSKKIASSRGGLLSVDVELHREHMSYDLLIASNKDYAQRAAKVFSKLLPTNLLVVDHSSFDVSPCWKKKALVREKLALRKRFLRFKERVITLKYRALKHLWKEDMLRLFTSGSCMSQKKFELSSPVVYRTKPKQRSFIRARISSREKGNKEMDRADFLQPLMCLDM